MLWLLCPSKKTKIHLNKECCLASKDKLQIERERSMLRTPNTPALCEGLCAHRIEKESSTYVARSNYNVTDGHYVRNASKSILSMQRGF